MNNFRKIALASSLLAGSLSAQAAFQLQVPVTTTAVAASPAPAPASVIVIQDTFTGVDGVNPEAHTADIGGLWISEYGVLSNWAYNEILWKLKGNRMARADDIGSTADSIIYNATPVPSQNVEVSVDIVAGPDMHPASMLEAWVTARYTGQHNAGVWTEFFANSTSCTVRIWSNVDAVVPGCTLAPNTTYRLRAVLQGTVHTVYVNDVQVLQGEIPAQWDPAGAYAGLGMNYQWPVDSVAFDDFTVKTLP